MYEERFTEADWNLFRKKLPAWQDAFMDQLNKEYMDILIDDGTPSEKFWKLDERIKEDRTKKGVVLQAKRSTLIYNLVGLMIEGAITEGDLEGFSDSLKEIMMNRYELEVR